MRAAVSRRRGGSGERFFRSNDPFAKACFAASGMKIAGLP
jgi:hypothetical protein